MPRCRTAFSLRVEQDDARSEGRVEPIDDPAGARQVMDLLIAKYWYLRPLVGIARMLGFDPTSDASFRVVIGSSRRGAV